MKGLGKLIEACARSGDLQSAERLLDQAAIEGVQASNVTLMMMLGLVAKSGEARKLQRWQKVLSRKATKAEIRVHRTLGVHALKS
eukprot:s2582_g19.t1